MNKTKSPPVVSLNVLVGLYKFNAIGFKIEKVIHG